MMTWRLLPKRGFNLTFHNTGRHKQHIRWLPKTNDCKAVKGHINTTENKGLAVTLNECHLQHDTSVDRAFNGYTSLA
ncbi:hypothetical protein DPMN_065279 [Dreissena polymorpha]|uniref:Uncharacterized protein n=1 Tax=Dreissena polymorpha TaxID=45954 RepID=A0A9D4CDS1_DREPO|nr:hypothetical protein DPMN_065279 [Dreissena polymorpha]